MVLELAPVKGCLQVSYAGCKMRSLVCVYMDAPPTTVCGWSIAALLGRHVEYLLWMVFLSVKVKIAGFRHKQSILLSKIMDKMTRFTVDQRRFAVHKENLARQLKNFKANQPYKHALYYMGVLLVQPCWTKEEMEEAVEGGHSIEHGPSPYPSYLTSILYFLSSSSPPASLSLSPFLSSSLPPLPPPSLSLSSPFLPLSLPSLPPLPLIHSFLPSFPPSSP